MVFGSRILGILWIFWNFQKFPRASTNFENIRIFLTQMTLSTDKYTRLSDTRSITPSPPLAPVNPPNTLSLKQNHVPSLSPINSSTESTPSSESPPMRTKANSNGYSPGARAKSIITARFTTITSILNNKALNRRLNGKLK